MNARFTIPAGCHSDDRVAETRFDAGPRFARASDEDLLEPAGCGWVGDYPADEVARFFRDDETAVVFDYLQAIRGLPGKKDVCGSECHVDDEAAVAWIERHRPRLLDQIVAIL